jgi:putative spermidine/putrescine transport system substrate-binding protein
MLKAVCGVAKIDFFGSDIFFSNNKSLMDRRSFLISLGTLALSQGLMGCRRNTSLLQVGLVAQSLPAQLVSRFSSSINAEADLKLLLAANAEQLFTELQQNSNPKSEPERQPNFLERILNVVLGPPPTAISPVISLGDYWLQTAVDQNLINPWPVNKFKGWDTLDPKWQNMVRRDRQGQPSPVGEIWGAPYRWGATGIAYRKDKFRDLGWTPTDWSDLWRPELKNKISLLDQPREVIGLTLKKLNHSYNTPNLETIPTLLAELKALDQQAQSYSSSHYLQPLLLEDTWVAVGWSADILKTQSEESEIGFVIPQSGTALWSDIWVWPKVGSSDPKLLEKWATFWWQSDIAKSLTQFTDAASTVRLENLPPGPTAQFLSSQPWFSNSDLLEPISDTTRQQYESLWQKMRS